MDPLLVERADGVVTCTLNRPDKKNAVTQQMWLAMIDLFEEVAVNRADRVLVITGAGDGFCSGADLADSGSADAATGVGSALAGMRIVGRAALALHALAKPTIAAVNGVAAGAGCNLALGCDLIVASDQARFSEIFAKRGLVVDFGGSWLLPRLVGMHRAKELVLLADVIDAVEAERIGLVNRVVAHELLAETVRSLALRLANMAPLTLAVSKRLLDQSLAVSMAEAIEAENMAQALMSTTHDTAEAILAFFEHREPRLDGS
ncbi:MAG: enoyl-CoA hydratase/isomerase family protein [Acidimicrobiia bacterium]